MCVVDFVEMRKNINQDKTLAIQHYVEKYHEQVNKMASYVTYSQDEETSHKETHHSVKQGKEKFQCIASLMFMNTALKVYKGSLHIGPHLSNLSQSNLFVNRSQGQYNLLSTKIQCIRKNFLPSKSP